MALSLAPWALALALAGALALHPWAGLLGLAGLALVPFMAAASVPGDLAALASPWVSGPALLFVSWELLRPLWRGRGRLAWEIVHVPVRLALAPLAGLLAAAGTGVAGDPALHIAAFTLALLIVLGRWGWHIGDELRGRPWRLTSPAGAWASALLAFLLAAGAVAAPLWAGSVALVGLVLAFRRPRRLLRLAAAFPGLVSDLGYALVGGPGWRGPERLPGWARAEAGPSPGNHPGVLRGTRALVHGKGTGDGTTGDTLRTGWLVVSDDAPVFVFRSPTRLWELPLEGATAKVPGPPSGPLLRRVDLRKGDERATLATSAGGPSPEELAALFGKGPAQETFDSG